jgi:hypothetical protein
MKNLPTYEQFNEQYLPYFGVKQALDDSANPGEPKKTIKDFNRIYAMDTTWWNAWKDENKDKYDFAQDAFTKTYNIKDKKSGELVFIYDYARFKIFTDQTPNLFVLKKDVSPEELQKAEDKASDMDKTEKEKEAEKKAANLKPKAKPEGEEDPSDVGSDEEEADDEFKL